LRKIIAFAIDIFEILLRFVWRGSFAGDLETSRAILRHPAPRSAAPPCATLRRVQPRHPAPPCAAFSRATLRHPAPRSAAPGLPVIAIMESHARPKKNARNRIFLIDHAAGLAI
jgi:hypothetical protein